MARIVPPQLHACNRHWLGALSLASSRIARCYRQSATIPHFKKGTRILAFWKIITSYKLLMWKKISLLKHCWRQHGAMCNGKYRERDQAATNMQERRALILIIPGRCWVRGV